jgi:hypothetical protein
MKVERRRLKVEPRISGFFTLFGHHDIRRVAFSLQLCWPRISEFLTFSVFTRFGEPPSSFSFHPSAFKELFLQKKGVVLIKNRFLFKSFARIFQKNAPHFEKKDNFFEKHRGFFEKNVANFESFAPYFQNNGHDL